MYLRNISLTPALLDSFPEFGGLHQMMNRMLAAADGVPAARFPAINVTAGEDALVVTAELPGLEAKDVDIQIEGSLFTLRGQRPELTVPDGQAVLRTERLFGAFVRSFELPFEVEAERVQATLKNGVLRVVLPRAEEAKPRRISVTNA